MRAVHWIMGALLVALGLSLVFGPDLLTRVIGIALVYASGYAGGHAVGRHRAQARVDQVSERLEEVSARIEATSERIEQTSAEIGSLQARNEGRLQ